MKYPTVLSEAATLEEAIAGRSLARFGDGELRLATGGSAISQREVSPLLLRELCAMLRAPSGRCLVCIPNAQSSTPKRPNWQRYAEPQFVRLYRPETVYGSSFITRPDSAPWIDTPEYWQRLPRLWQDKDVILVRGDGKSLVPDLMTEARSIREVMAPRQNAYREIHRIEADIGDDVSKTVILCLGATATCLAWRLSAKGFHALDLGHVGMFMRHKGKYHGVSDPKEIEALKKSATA